MNTESVKQQCIDYLAEIAQPGPTVCLTQQEADFLEVDLWDQDDILEEGGQDGK